MTVMLATFMEVLDTSVANVALPHIAVAMSLQAGGASPPDAAVRAQGMIYGTLLKQSGMLAFADAFWVMGALFLVILPLMFLIRQTPPK